MKGILHKTKQGWVVRWTKEDHRDPEAELPLHPENMNGILVADVFNPSMDGKEVDFDWCVIVDHDTGKGIQYAKLMTPMIAMLREHLNNITPEQFKQEIKDIEDSMNFICEDPDCPHCGEEIRLMQEDEDDDLTDDEWLIKEKHKEIEATAIDFAKWLAKDWMSIWVVDKWLWEYQTQVDSKHPYFGYKTEEELFELYKVDRKK